MYRKIETWLNNVLEYKIPSQIPSSIRAFCFNLYEGGNGDWSMELVGTGSFDPNDEDWACDEITDFGTREEPLSWEKETDWSEVLSEVSSALQDYLENGLYADVLKSRMGVAVGFTDGNLEILYSDPSGMAQAGIPDKTDLKEKIKRMIEQKISEWQEDDIYAISLYVNDENDDPRRPVAVLGYNTESQVQESLSKASDGQEARWNYAFWLRNEELCLGRGDTAEDVSDWIRGRGLWDQEDEITEAFVRLLVMIVKDIHASGLLKNKFGKELPFLIHELEYYDIIAAQNIEANGESLVRDFVLFCLGDEIPNVSSIMPASKSEIPEFKSGLPSRYYSALAHSTAVSREKLSKPKKAAEKGMMFLAALIFILWLCVCLYFLYLHIRDTAVDRQNIGEAARENNTDRTDIEDIEKEELYVPATAIPDAASDSYTLIYDGMDTDLEIFLKDCACEYNRDSIQLYSCFVDDAAVEAKGYAIYIRTPEEVMQFFPAKDYQVDKNAGKLIMVRGTETFEGIEGIDFVNGMKEFTIKNTYFMESLIGDAYGLKLSERDETFDDLQVEFIGLYQEKSKTLLRGKTSALYHITGKRYTVDWEIDTESLQENTKAFLADFDIHPLYAAFLRNEISVKNPFVPEDSDYSKLSFFDDMEDEDEPLIFWKSFSLVDVNGDGNAELIFKMINSPSEEMYILGVYDNELICFDILLTHTTHMSFRVCDNGIVDWGQNYDGDETVYYTFNNKGKEQELIHFVREENSDSELYYDYYYLGGNEKSRINLQSNEEYESLVSSYEGEEPVWFACDSFADIPQNQLIAKTEIAEKNEKNTDELRISIGITKLWLNEDEDGAAEINAALREIYEAAEAEMETYNQEILDEYLFEDGVLQEDLDEWLLYPLDEWLSISEENYAASIEYADENYLCLSMNGDNYVAGGAHGYYWSDYYVFNRHTGQRLSLEDFVNDSAEEIKEIVKTRILAVAPYSKGEQSEYALEQNRFFLTAEGLGIHYDVYEISDYAAGSFDLIIPFKLFDMKEDMWPGRNLTFYEKGLRFEEE